MHAETFDFEVYIYIHICVHLRLFAGGAGDQLSLSEGFPGKVFGSISNGERAGGHTGHVCPPPRVLALGFLGHATPAWEPTCQMALCSIAVDHVLVNSMDAKSGMVKAWPQNMHACW